MTREKLLLAVTVKLDEQDVAALDRYVRECVMASGHPTSRSVVVREILRRELRPEATAVRILEEERKQEEARDREEPSRTRARDNGQRVAPRSK